MHIEKLHERVAVRADFRGGVITPVAVARRSGERFRVESVSGRWVERSGPRSTSEEAEKEAEKGSERSRGGRPRERRAPCFYFTVQMGGATYELAFDSDIPEWWLERVMVE